VAVNFLNNQRLYIHKEQPWESDFAKIWVSTRIGMQYKYNKNMITRWIGLVKVNWLITTGD
jgi:hypothetical protein